MEATNTEDAFVMIAPASPSFSSHGSSSKASTHVRHAYQDNLTAPRVLTEGVLAAALRSAYPAHHLVISAYYTFDVLAYADAHPSDVSYKEHLPASKTLTEKLYVPPERRHGDETGGAFAERILFRAVEYRFRGTTFVIYIADGGEGMMQRSTKVYMLVPPERKGRSDNSKVESGAPRQEHSDEQTARLADDLLATVTRWMQDTHQEILVYDGGNWTKSKELWQNVQKSEWSDVILAENRKDAIIKDVNRFFDGESKYAEYGVPWKRGIIFYGPPGNGKTISTKALMHALSQRQHPRVDSLYVKSLSSYAGPQYAIRQIFQRARRTAPCLLIFEDLDSLITPGVRSYFLNEVDGLEANTGILMLGSTNHLDRLDPGLSRRPSRFDRKYRFDNPDRAERVLYCRYWQRKLAAEAEVHTKPLTSRDRGEVPNEPGREEARRRIDFTDRVVERAADETDGFSFAYIKEAMVATLLVIAGEDDDEEDKNEQKQDKRKTRIQEDASNDMDPTALQWRDLSEKGKGDVDNDDDDLKHNRFWQELKTQIANLRSELQTEDGKQVVCAI